MIDITAIIPVYNGAKFVGAAVESIQNQTVPVAEILVVDDCSADNTAAIVRDIAARDPRVRLMSNTVNSGPAHSRNRALIAATSTVCAFLDADDLWRPSHVACIAAAFSKFPGASLAYTNRYDETESQVHELNAAIDVVELENPLVVLLKDNPIMQSGAAVRAAEILAMGGYAEGGRFAEDYELWMRLARKSRTFVHVKVPTVVHTIHDDQVSKKFSLEMYRWAWGMRKAAVEERDPMLQGTDKAMVARVLLAEKGDFESAFTLRRRDIIEQLLQSTDWIPAPKSRLDRYRRMIGWRWYVVRMVTGLYDMLPARAKQMLRASRQRRATETEA